MNRLLAILSFVFVMMGGYNQKAQAQVHLTIDSLINFPDTAFIGQAYPIAIRIKNIGNQPYQGPLQVGLMQDSAFTYLYYNQNPSIVIFPNDTLTLYTANGMLGFVFDSAVFRPGNNVVVVWPYSTQSSTQVDSMTTQVFVQYTTGIKNNLTDVKLQVYPNPFKDKISFTGNIKSDIERVRIISLEGIVIYDKKFLNPSLLLNGLQPGWYMVDVEVREGKHLYCKMIKE